MPHAPGPGARYLRLSGTGRGGPAPFNPVTDPLLFALYRETAVDAGAGACSQWTDLGPGGLHLTPPSAGARPTIVAEDADFGGEPSLSLDGGDYVRASDGADTSNWKFLHDASVATLELAFRSGSTSAIQAVLSSFSSISANNVGFAMRFDGTSENLDLIVANGSGTSVINVSTALGSCVRDATHFVVWRKNGTGWELWIDGAIALSGGYTGTPAAGNPQTRLHVGANAAPNGQLTGKVAEVGIVKAYRDAALVSAYGLARY